MQNKKVCIFIDGENLRHAICDLFPLFNKFDYLPKNAEWTKFFDWIARETGGSDAERIRAYWYAIKSVDYTPYSLSSLQNDPIRLENILCRNDVNRQHIISCVDQATKIKLMEELLKDLESKQATMEKRFTGWIRVQDGIASKHTAVEFRRAGHIRYDLFTRELGSEKAVDVNLAVDLVRLKDIYDIAVIVSGDQDYVPAVNAVKDYGKRVINVSFQKDNGQLLPGGARRLNQVTDSSVEVTYQKSKSFFNL